MNIKFHDGRCTRPKDSGTYLVMLADGMMWDCNYSSKHGAWNASDNIDDNKHIWNDVIAWAVKPSVEEMEEEVW